MWNLNFWFIEKQLIFKTGLFWLPWWLGVVIEPVPAGFTCEQNVCLRMKGMSVLLESCCLWCLWCAPVLQYNYYLFCSKSIGVLVTGSCRYRKRCLYPAGKYSWKHTVAMSSAPSKNTWPGMQKNIKEFAVHLQNVKRFSGLGRSWYFFLLFLCGSSS